MGKKDKNTEEAPKRSFRRWLTKKNIFIGLLVLIFLIQYIQIQRVFGTFSIFENKDTSLISEIGQLMEGYQKMGGDLNEVREFLRMPTGNYAGFTEVEEEKDADKNENTVQLAFFKYVEYLGTSKNLDKNIEANKKYLNDLAVSVVFSNLIKEQNLVLSPVSETSDSVSFGISLTEGDTIVLYYLSKEDGVFYRKTLNEKTELKVQDQASFEQQEMNFIKTNKDALSKKLLDIKTKRTKIENAIASKEVQDKAVDLGITIKVPGVEANLKITYSILNKASELIGEIVLDTKTGKITLTDAKNPDVKVEAASENLQLVPFLEKLDTKTFIEKKVADAKTNIEQTLADKGFQSQLTESGLKIDGKAREDAQRYYYDIYDAEGQKLSSIVIEKSTGVINITASDGTNSENLLFFDPEFKKKTLTEVPENVPDYGNAISHDDDTFNILIAGKHGNLMDTMIFVHLDETKGEMRMVSIPRDLFYNGRKINAFAYFYGMDELKKVLSEITGYKLDKYILIDMYAFIEVIDLVGGIDVHLDSPVIDPTYKTIDNGVEGTLHYEPGDYHLGGKEALRLARTRHTSSDFARAARQQMIIEALQDKARNFGFGDADTIYEIAKVVLGKTETDISLDEAIVYYFRYQNYKILSNAVMSSGNILYVPPYITTEECQRRIEEAAASGQSKPGCENENHAYTLLPANNNWNVIKWFFKEQFDPAT